MVGTRQWQELKGSTRQQLEFSGWADAVRHKCRDYMARNDGTSSLTHADVVSHVHGEALMLVPDHIKADILQQIKTLLVSYQQGEHPEAPPE